MATTADFIRLGAKAFFEQHPLVPSLLPSNQGVPIGAQPKPLLKRSDGHGWDPTTSLDSVPGLSRVRYGEIVNTEGSIDAYLKQFSGDPLGLRKTSVLHRLRVHSFDTGNALVPLFYLPYRNDYNIRITLKAKPAEPELRGIHFFVTEPVDGCSVYVEGTRQEPTVYHINAQNTKRKGQGTTGNFAHDSRVWRTKWRHMDTRFRSEGKNSWTVQRAVGLVQACKVENDDYMIRAPEQMSAYVRAARDAMPKRIDGRKPDDLFITTQGTVFGCLEADGWHFYVQRRLQVVYQQTAGQQAPVALGSVWVPLAVKEFWPTTETGRAV